MIEFYNSLSSHRQKLFHCLLLAAATLIAYCNIYHNEFLFDDGLIITLNTLLHSWDTFGRLLTASTTEGAHIAGGFYRPVQIILYFFIYQVFGESTVAFHALNIALHTANTCLVYILGRKLGFNPWAVFLAALLWTLHPIHTEAVTYMSATADTLYSFFCLLGIILLVPDFTTKKTLAVIPIFLLGILSKETAAVFPLLVIVTIYYVNPKRLTIKPYLNTWPLWIIAFLFILWRLTSQSYDGPATYAKIYQSPDYANLRLYSEHFFYRLCTFFATLPAYVGLLLWPADLHMERNFSIYTEFWELPVLEGVVVFLAAAWLPLFSRSQRLLPLSWGLLWFAAAHLPNSGLLLSVNSLFLEHWMYLPTAGLFLGAAQTLFLYMKEIKLGKYYHSVAGIILAIALLFGVLTVRQNETWHDAVTFYHHLLKYDVVSARVHNNLALAYVNRKDYPHAIEEFNKAIAITDTYAETRHNLALALLDLPDQEDNIPKAITNLQRALEINPNFYRSYIALEQIYAYKGDKEKAEFFREKAEAILAKDKFSP